MRPRWVGPWQVHRTTLPSGQPWATWSRHYEVGPNAQQMAWVLVPSGSWGGWPSSASGGAQTRFAA